MSKTNQELIADFAHACNELIDGRFILSDIKISKLLATVAESTDIYNVVASCLEGYDFNEAFNTYKSDNFSNGSYFAVPENPKEIIALVFCLLREVKNNHINLQKFIADNFFSAQGYNNSYSNFAITMLTPFKESVLIMLGCNEEGEQVVEPYEEEAEEEFFEEEEVVSSNYFDNGKQALYANVTVALQEVVNAIKLCNKIKLNAKEELLIVANCMAEAINQQNLKLISALCVAFEYALSGNRQVRPSYMQFKNCLGDVLAS